MKYPLRQQIKNSFPQLEKLFTLQQVLQFYRMPPEKQLLFEEMFYPKVCDTMLPDNGSLKQAFLAEGFCSEQAMCHAIFQEYHRYLTGKEPADP